MPRVRVVNDTVPLGEHFEAAPASGTANGGYGDAAAANFDIPPRAIFTSAAGNLSLVNLDGTTVVFTVVAGATLRIRFLRLNATGTTVTTPGTNIRFLW